MDKNLIAESLAAQVAAAGDAHALRSVVSGIHAADIAEAFELLEDEARSSLLYALAPRTAAEVIVLLDEADRGELVEDMDEASLTQVVAELPPDDAVDVLGELSDQQREEVLDHIPDEHAGKLEELLRYDEDTAGGIMTPDVIALETEATVADSVRHVREASSDEDLHEIYVTDADRRLIGIVPLRRLVTAAKTAKLGELCIRDPIVVTTDVDQEAVAQIIRKYDLPALAVVDSRHRLIGRITHDDIMDVVEEEAAEDLYRMAGTDAAELETSSVVHAARVRLTWLIPCLLGTALTASVIMYFETSSGPRLPGTQILVLLSFVPMIGAMGGNSGIQTSTIIVRGFATGDLAVRAIGIALAREVRIGVILSMCCGLAAGVVSLLCILAREQLLGADHMLGVQFVRTAVSVGLGMVSAIFGATFLGVVLPFSFRRLNVDPAIASGPLVTTVNDLVSVSIYLSISMVILLKG
ncbi:MAG: magnesium transporter [Planctomycetes bacterium]|nr:magnesium transporter [Planctomycetota bacterium]